jgi:hypothetical protein
MYPSPFICIKSIHQIISLHEHIIMHCKKNSSKKQRSLRPQKKANGLSILRDAKPKHLQIRKKGATSIKKAKGLSILRDAKPKHLRLRKRKVQPAQKSQWTVDLRDTKPKSLQPRKRKVKKHLCLWITSRNGRRTILHPLQTYHLFQVQIVESTSFKVVDLIKPSTQNFIPHYFGSRGLPSLLASSTTPPRPILQLEGLAVTFGIVNDSASTDTPARGACCHLQHC